MPACEVIHNWNVDARDQTEDHHEGVNEAKVGHDTVAETSDRILAFRKSKVEHRLIRGSLTVGELEVLFF